MKNFYELGVMAVLIFMIPIIFFNLPDEHPFNLLTTNEALTLSAFVCLMGFMFYLRVKSIFDFVRPLEDADENFCENPDYCDELSEIEQK